MDPINPVGQNGYPHQRPAQHPGVWEFAGALEETADVSETPVVMPTANMPRISLQIQEMLSQPLGATLKAYAEDKRKANLGPQDGEDRRQGDRRSRRRVTDV